VSAREAYLHACNYYRASYTLLFGAPVDPRLIEAFAREAAAFLKAAALFEPVEIPYEGNSC
jgi:hypothetical protein